MHCPLCQNLERALEDRQREYLEAVASAYFRVSRKLAAYRGVELERARLELEEHRSICVSILDRHAVFVKLAPPRFAQNEPWREREESAA